MKLSLYTDGSVDSRSKIGYGSYLAVSEDDVFEAALLSRRVRTKRFEHTSSTRLELEILLWALGAVEAPDAEVTIYTDSQNITGLPSRRARLEGDGYRSKNNRRLRNTELYQQFFEITDRMDCEFVKVDGHLQSIRKSEKDRLFSLVDRASRNALRRYIRSQR
jgi:ribonuclease HI